MYVSWHVGLTTPLAGAMAITDPVGAALFWAGGVLIDTDHYLDHLYFNRNWSLKRAYRWHITYGTWLQRHPGHRHLCLFHTVESLGLVMLAAWFWPPLWSLVGGMLFHLCLDKIYDYQMRAFWIRTASVVQWAFWARKNTPWVMTESMLAEETALPPPLSPPKKHAPAADLLEIGSLL